MFIDYMKIPKEENPETTKKCACFTRKERFLNRRKSSGCVDEYKLDTMEKINKSFNTFCEKYKEETFEKVIVKAQLKKELQRKKKAKN